MSVRFFAAAVGASLLVLPLAFAQADTSAVTPTSCDQLFSLPQGTISTVASSQYLNAQTCSAYQYLIARYSPGPCSAVGFTNAKVQGITSLNTQFAQELTQMLQAASAAGYTITINSAFRTVQGEKCANPRGFEGNAAASMHTKGLAADLQYPNDSNSAHGCDSGSDSAAYLWVAANAKKYGLGLYDQLHSHVNGECNHVEASTAVAGGIGPGGGGTVAAPQALPTSVLSATRNPLLVPSSPLTTSATNPFATAPITPTQPAPQLASQLCTPRYYCSNSTAYYESSTCSTSVFEACQYGCSGTVCAPAPASTNALPSVSANSALGTTGITPTGTSTSLALNTGLSQSVDQGLASSSGSVITTIATSGEGYAPDVGASTFPSYDAGESSYQSSSPLSRVLDSLKNVLTGLLSYLRSL